MCLNVKKCTIDRYTWWRLKLVCKSICPHGEATDPSSSLFTKRMAKTLIRLCRSMTNCQKHVSSIAESADCKGNDALSMWRNAFKIILAPFWKRVFSKRKEFAPSGSKLFPFRADPFSEGTWCADQQTGRLKYCLLCKGKWQNIYQVTPVLTSILAYISTWVLWTLIKHGILRIGIAHIPEDGFSMTQWS